MALSDPTWFDELERCPRRAFVDGDPLFTQVAMEKNEEPGGVAPRHYPVLFTVGTRLGQADCTVPSAGRTWIPTRSVVATRTWTVDPPNPEGPVTALMHWAAGSAVTWNGRSYGHKDVEFERFIDLPRRASRVFQVALGGRRAPRERIAGHGWRLVDPLSVTATSETYRQFITGSYADFGIAKNAFVASRSGWFSDRSTCFLAAGRPVLHQDTGFDEWLPQGAGVLRFSEPEECLEALRCLELDYPRHVRAARRLAEEYLEASTVVGRMLDDAGFR
jgi:hypothetical protein